MSTNTAEDLVADDKQFCWHPFTPQSDWTAPDHEPIVITSGHGVWLRDAKGREFLDGNSSIWTNIHGHAHPTINRFITEQLGQVAHTSYLGYTNEPSIRLARKLLELFPGDTFGRVFYSDNGSTAIEAGLRMALQYFHQNGQAQRNRIVAFDNAYHGDTLGAASVGGISAFHGHAHGMGFPTDRVTNLDQFHEVMEQRGQEVAIVIIEPLIQGAGGMKTWPAGMLPAIREACDEHGALMMLDEVMTAFGRTGKMFACQQEGVYPDILAVAKGITGGYVPLAATFVTERIYEGFLGPVEQMRTFYYGHSYTANPVGCAAALGSLQVFEDEKTLEHLPRKITLFGDLLQEAFDGHPHVSAIRQCGLICGLDLIAHKSTGETYPPSAQQGARVCLAAREHKLLTRAVRNTLTLMPPLSTSPDELRQMVAALRHATDDVCSDG
jgi:adenosylmethionine-8-amino-7-oxononanoate aminotransferase